ncbi:MAG: ion transporter, partial [Acidobacteriota bacterium]
MSRSTSRLQTVLDVAERLLDAHSTRLLLSVAIIVSVLPQRAQQAFFPDAWIDDLDTFFLCVFSIELLMRLGVYIRRWQAQSARSGDLLLLFLDLIAVLSFLPLEAMLEAESLRVFRLSRMLLLVGYWGRMARDLLAILTGPERRYQVIGVLFLGLLLSFGSAVVVPQLVPHYDFDDDGRLSDSDRSFFRILWWSFRQVQDTGNLVDEIDQPWIVLVSLLLTSAGLLLFSLVIGIGTGAIEEVLTRSREQPLALQNHTVVLGLTPHSVFLLDGLAKIYRKNLKAFRAAVLGPTPEAPAYLHQPLLRTFQYRHGDPIRAGDLDRVNIERAKRVLILGADPQNPDGEVISAILATRERNPSVDLYPDVEHERNFRAVRSAGGPYTHLVGSGSFLGHYIVHNVAYPGAYNIYRQLLTSSGSEVYTYMFSREERQRLLAATETPSFDPAALHRFAYRAFGVTSIGLFTAEGDGEDSASEDSACTDSASEDPAGEDLTVLLNPVRAARAGENHAAIDAAGHVKWSSLRGLAGIALRWREVRRLGQTLVESPAVGERGAGRPGGFGDLQLHPACSRIERVLIIGASLRVPRVVVGLLGFYPRLTVTVLVQSGDQLRRIGGAVQSALTDNLGRPPASTRGEDELELRFTDQARDLRVLLLDAGWSDQARLRQAQAVDPESADAILLLPGASRVEELDGSVALDCLHLANLTRSGDLETRPGLHVLGMVRDAVKGDLLESRLERISGPESQTRFTIISSERARHHFIMQNVFVRGLNPLYLELLNAEGQHLSRLLARCPDGGTPPGDFDSAELGRHLLLDRGLVFVGLELDDGAGGFRIELDPQQMPPG